MSWLDGIRLAVRLAERGILVLADRGTRSEDTRIGDLVRALLADHGEVAVCVEAVDLEQLEHGAVVVYAPRSEDATALNLGRPLLAERALRVILWCESEAAARLATQAPDFFDWISHRFEAPQGPLVPRYVVAMLRRADEEQVPVAWPPNFRPEPFVERASPDTPTLHRVKGPKYVKLVDGLLAAPADGWTYIYSLGRDLRHRARWAMAEVGRRKRVLLVGPNPGFWPITVAPLALPDAIGRLRRRGCARLHAGRIAALVDLERGAVEIASALLGNGTPIERVNELVLSSADPGAALAQELARSGQLDLDYVARRCTRESGYSAGLDLAAMPLLRGLAGQSGIRVRSDRLWAETAHAIQRGERMQIEDLGWWAASSPGREAVPLPLLDLPRQTLVYAIEASLWDPRWHVHPGLRARAASKLGEFDAAEHWAAADVGSVADVLAALRAADRLRAAGRFADSLQSYDGVLHLARRERMPLPLLAEVHARRALSLHELGRYEQVCAELEPLVHDIGLPVAMAALGRALIALWRDLDRAHELLERALRLENGDSFVVACCVEEAVAHGHYAQAHDLLAGLSPADLTHMSLVALLGDLLRREGRVVEARRLVAGALTPGGALSLAAVALASTTLGAILVDGGDYLTARARLDEARGAALMAFGEHHPLLAAIGLWMGRCWARLGKPSTAKEEFLGALRTTRFFYGEDHPRTHELVFEIALAQRVGGDGGANTMLRASFTRLEELLGAAHPEILRMRGSLNRLPSLE